MNLVKASISRSALRHNALRVKQLAPHSKVLAMVKADAYGHDSVEVIKALKGSEVDAFGVARFNEAQRIVESGLNVPLILMEGCFSSAELQQAASLNFSIVIQNSNQLEQFLTTKLAKPVDVWLKLETGMHRLGIQSAEVDDFYQKITNCENCDEIRFMTHFACADNRQSSMTAQQLEKFDVILSQYQEEKACANSAGIMVHPDSHKSWVRPGIMLFGSSPVIGTTAKDFDLRAVMTLTSEVIAVNKLHQGESVGYGQTWTANKETQIAVIAMGYGDGYPRHAAIGTPVLINGVEYPLVGKVSMDMLTVDVGNDKVTIGDKVELWGPNLPAEVVAEKAETISYELFCNISNRVEKVFTK